MRTFFYALGSADEFQRRYRVPADAIMIVEAADQVDRLLHCRPAWRRLVKSPWRELLRGVAPTRSALAGDLIIVPDLASLGPFWRGRGKSLSAAIARKIVIRVLDVEGEPFDIPAPLTPEVLVRLEQVANEAMAGYHRRRVREGLATARAAGKVCNRPPFGWPVVNGHVIPNGTDLRTIRTICRRYDDEGWTLKDIAADFAATGRTRADGRLWNLGMVSRAWRYGVARGWARPRRRPWDLVKRRLATSA